MSHLPIINTTFDLPDNVIFMMFRKGEGTTAGWAPEWIAECADNEELLDITESVMAHMMSVLRNLSQGKKEAN